MDKNFRILLSHWEGKKQIMNLFYKRFGTIAEARDDMKTLEVNKLYAGYEFTVIKVTGVDGYNEMEVA